MNEDTQKKRKRRSRRSPAQWAEIVERWRASNQSAEEFAKENDVGADGLWRWSSRLRIARPLRAVESGQQASPRVAPRFVEVEVARPTQPVGESTAAARGIVIEWPGGPTVRVSGGGVDRGSLVAVLQALAEVAPC